MSPSGFPTWEESSHVGFLSAPLLQTPRGEFSAWRTAMATVDVVAATIRSSSSAVASLFPFPKLRRSRSFSSSCLPTCVEITNISHIWSTFTFNNMTTEQLTLTTSSIGKKNPLKYWHTSVQQHQIVLLCKSNKCCSFKSSNCHV